MNNMGILSFLLMVAVIIVMMAATFVEQSAGSASFIYGSWWFASLWTLLCVCGLLHCFRRKLYMRPVVMLLHLSFVVILVGALVTHVFGQQGVMHLRVGLPARTFLTNDAEVEKLPFELMLSDFEVIAYPGTSTPMDYKSTLLVNAGVGERQDTVSVSMNRIAELHNYRFYQTSYDEDMMGSVLSVSHDPVGIGITYVGYGLLFISMLLLLVLPGEGFRRALRRLAVMAGLLVFSMGSLWASPQTLPQDEAQAFCSLYGYYNGRICPIQTIAKDFTTKLYGKDHYGDLSCEQVFTGWVFYPSSWTNVPRKERKARYKEEQGAVVEMFMAGEFLRIFPSRSVASDSTLTWLCPSDSHLSELPDDEMFFVGKSLNYVVELGVTRNHDKYLETVGKIRRYQQKVAGEVLPSDRHFAAEMFYNKADYTRPLAMAFATLGIVLFLFFVVRLGRGRQVPSWLVYVCDVLIVLAFVYLLLLFGLRWYVSGHLPLANGYETMQFMALSLLLLTLVMQRRFLLVLPFGFLLGGLTLLVSMMGQSNPQITHLMPVLQSPLLSLHVCVIMISYSLLAFTFLTGLAALLSRQEAFVHQLADVSRMLLYPALFCMAAGIFIGAIWANVSWGRYWGWDPKEVWALITLLVYAFAFHSESLPIFRRPRFFHIFMVLAFLTVLMTYFGVNFVLGGMHSYATS